MEFDATFLIAAVSFIVFVFIMNKIFYAPVMKIMEKREIVCGDNFSAAEKINAETAEKEKLHAEKLEEARSEVRGRIDSEVQRINSEKSKIISDYKMALLHNAEEEQKNLRKSAYDARETLKENAFDIAAEISQILLGSRVNTAAAKNMQSEEK